MTPSPFSLDRPAAEAAAPALPPAETRLERCRRALRRRRRLILGLALTGTLFGALAGLLVTPRYTATALVLLGSQASPAVALDASAIDTRIRLLASPSHLEQVMARLDPADVAALAGPRTDRRAALADAARRQLLAWLPPSWLVAVGLAEEPLTGTGSPTAAPISPPDTGDALRALADGLVVEQEGRSAILAVTFSATDPGTAARIANAVAEGDVAARSGWPGAGGPDARLAALQAEAEAAEAALERFRHEHGAGAGGVGEDEPGRVALEAKLAEAEAELARRAARRDGLRAFREQRATLVPPPEVADVAGLGELIRHERELVGREAELAATYGERHPRRQLARVEREQLSAEIEQQLDAIAAGLERAVADAAGRVTTIAAELEATQASRAEAETTRARLAELEQAARATRHRHDSLRQHPSPGLEADETPAAGARVIAPATPPTRPSTPGLPLMAAMGLTVSTTFATLLALLLERLDKGLRSEREVLAALGLPRIGLVPRIDARQPSHAYLLRRPLSAYAEAMRAILMSLDLAAEPGHLPRLILVTSSLPEEGKTTLAVSLAACAARSGRRTILLDLDLRHPKVDRELQLRADAGIVEHLLGDLPLEQVVAREPRSGLDVIAVRERTADPMPLLAGARLLALLELLRVRYDLVLIDGPPLLGITDAQILARRVDAVLLAVRWGSTARGPVQAAVRLLRAARAPLAGVVLTRVDLKKHASYRFGDVGEYYPNYEKYYVN